jgi:hypothetical protein
MMEHREDGLLVDFSGSEFEDTGKRVGNAPIVYDAKQEREHETLKQESALMRAMNEIRQYQPKRMSPEQREKFNVLCESIFRAHGIKPENYQQYFGHLGTQGQLRRA